MSTSKEHVFATGASETMGSDVVRGLIQKGIHTSAYVQNEQKARDSFKNELNTGHLTIVIVTYSSVNISTK
jgi:uncharacterized protein YbjT (DUF2867 family)